MKCLETSRLNLRAWKVSDLDDLYELISNQKIAELAGFKVRETMKASLPILMQFIKDSLNSLWAIELKENHKVIGWIEMHSSKEWTNHREAEIGFVLSQHYWGQGLMPEGLKEVINYAFQEEEMEVLLCDHFIHNHQSKRVIEKCRFKSFMKTEEKIYYRLEKNLILDYKSATGEDIEIIFEMNQKLIQQYEDLSQINYEIVQEWVQQKIERNVSQYQVILNGEIKVGYYFLHEVDDELELDDLYVLEAYQGQGIGSQILENCIKIASEQHKGLFLYVFAKNARAIKFYESFGFYISETIKDTRYIMRRDYYKKMC